jgi:hypothetical protein
MKNELPFSTDAVLLITGLDRIGTGGGAVQFYRRQNVYERTVHRRVFEDWYADEVALAMSTTLCRGKQRRHMSRQLFRLSEAITLAARMHSIYYTGSNTLTNGSPWYRPYVDYALENDIIASEYPNYDAYATRAQFAVIFADALPPAALEEINEIESGAIPDVSYSSSYGPSVYTLYRAGVLIGNDSVGTFKPNDNIKRSEVATIVARMTNTSYRKSLTLPPSIYYTDYYPVPDYGTYMNVSVYQSEMYYDIETGTYNTGYSYRLSAISSDYEDYFYGYGDLLAQNGFTYQLEYLDEYGYPTLYYINASYGLHVFFGPTVVDGFDCMIVIIGTD